MADLVNQTHRSGLASRNAEASHLGSGSVESLGGPGTASEPGGSDYKIDADRGITKDTSIPASVGPEASHLKTEGDEDDLDVKFDEDDDIEVDDLDKQLESLDDLEPVDIDIDTDLREDDEDEDKDKVEEDDENPFAKKDDEDDKKVDESDDEDEIKDKLDESDDEDEKEKEKVDEDDDSDDEKEKVDEDDENPFAKKDKDDEDEKNESDDEDEDKDKIEESLKIRIKMPDVKLFESAGLGARTQKKVATIFESAIRATTKQVAAQVRAHYKKLHESKIAKRDAIMAKQMDGYLSYVVEEWTKQNRPALRQSLRVQLAEEFLTGLQRLFKEHYIDVPESKIDVVKKLTEQNSKLKSALNESAAKSIKMRKLTEQVNKRRIVAEFALAQRLSEASTQKLQKLAEDTSYTNAKDFREKLTMLKESYFPTGTKAATKTKRLPDANLTESVEKPKQTVTVHPEVAAIASALDKKSAW